MLSSTFFSSYLMLGKYFRRFFLYFCLNRGLPEHLLNKKRKCKGVLVWTFGQTPPPPLSFSAGSKLLGERLSWEKVAERELNTWCFYAKVGIEPGLLEFQMEFSKISRLHCSSIWDSQTKYIVFEYLELLEDKIQSCYFCLNRFRSKISILLWYEYIINNGLLKVNNSN